MKNFIFVLSLLALSTFSSKDAYALMDINGKIRNPIPDKSEPKNSIVYVTEISPDGTVVYKVLLLPVPVVEVEPLR